MINLIALLLCMSFLNACEDQLDLSAQNDFMYEGSPIHPGNFECLQLYKPNPIESKEFFEDTFDFEPCHPVMGDEDKLFEYSSNKRYSSYKVLGRYQGKHLVEVRYGQYNTTGRFAALCLLERKGDTIIYSEHVTGGDRWYGGYFSEARLEGNKVKFKDEILHHTIVSLLTGNPSGCPMSWGGIKVLCSIDLDDGLKMEIEGLELSWKEGRAAPNSNDVDEICNSVVHQYVKDGRTQLNLEEAKEFAEKVISKCLSKRSVEK